MARLLERVPLDRPKAGLLRVGLFDGWRHRADRRIVEAPDLAPRRLTARSRAGAAERDCVIGTEAAVTEF